MKGHFGRDMVAATRAAMTWPGMEATEQLRAGKALREGDVWELHLLHRLVETRAGQHAASRVRNQRLLHTLSMVRPSRRGLRSNLLSDGAPAVTNQNLLVRNGLVCSARLTRTNGGLSRDYHALTQLKKSL